jgi:hypothetical protein
MRTRRVGARERVFFRKVGDLEKRNSKNIRILKGTVSPDYICLKVVWFIRPRLGHVTLDIKKNIFLSL